MNLAAKHAVILGAVMMGAAIAYVAAGAGIEITLTDVSREAAEHGKSYSEGLLEKAVASGRASEQQAAALLARITPTAKVAEAGDADVVIEAVFEDPEVKAAALREIEPLVRADALLASNTSTLPISGLAGYVSRPADFIGLHFFSPVDKMALLEIVRVCGFDLPLMLEPYRKIDDRRLTKLQRYSPERRVQHMLDRLTTEAQ